LCISPQSKQGVSKNNIDIVQLLQKINARQAKSGSISAKKRKP
jgi:hypothetical protein